MLEAREIYKSFKIPPTDVLFGISFKIEAGEFVSITGRSGSGKSTLLYILSSLDVPTQGDVLIDGREMGKMTSEEIHHFRNETMGFIFQFHYLLPELNAVENILMPARKTNRQVELQSRALELLAKVGLAGKEHRLPKELSGGEQQRVAIARALIMSPKYIFADEPTGNLDSTSGNIVMDILEDITKTSGTAVIFVTHDREFAARAKHRIQIADGKLV